MTRRYFVIQIMLQNNIPYIVENNVYPPQQIYFQQMGAHALYGQFRKSRH